jgi:hypothetical protein
MKRGSLIGLGAVAVGVALHRWLGREMREFNEFWAQAHWSG